MAKKTPVPLETQLFGDVFLDEFPYVPDPHSPFNKKFDLYADGNRGLTLKGTMKYVAIGTGVAAGIAGAVYLFLQSRKQSKQDQDPLASLPPQGRLTEQELYQ